MGELAHYTLDNSHTDSAADRFANAPEYVKQDIPTDEELRNLGIDLKVDRKSPPFSRVFFDTVASGRTFLVGCERTLQWIEPSKRKIVRVIDSLDSHVTAVACSHDGELVATGTHNGFIHVWSVSDGELLLKTHPLPKPVYTLAWGPDSEFVLATDRESLYRVDAVTGAIRQPEVTSHLRIRKVHQTSDPRRVVVMHSTREVFVCDPGELKPQSELPSGSAGEGWLSDDGKLLITTCGLESPGIWNAQTGEHLASIDVDTQLTHAMFLSSESAVLCGIRGRMWRWNFLKGEIIALQSRYPFHVENGVVCELDDDTAFATSGPRGGLLRLWGGKTGALKLQLDALAVSRMIRRPRGVPSMEELSRVGLRDGQLVTRLDRDGSQVQETRFHRSAVSPNGRLVAISGGGQVRPCV